MKTVNYDSNGLVPAIVQDAKTSKVLMMGYMNDAALEITKKTGMVTFYSRKRQRLWTKGEESGNVLQLVGIKNDCDGDTLLNKANPAGPTCHTGSDTCWGETNSAGYGFLDTLQEIIASRQASGATDSSYVARLFDKGINSIAQKVGEEAVEVVIEAKDNNDDLFLEECADLLFHYLVLLRAKGKSIKDVLHVLEARHKPAGE